MRTIDAIRSILRGMPFRICGSIDRSSVSLRKSTVLLALTPILFVSKPMPRSTFAMPAPGTLFLGAQTVAGPGYLGVGFGNNGAFSIYLLPGAP